MATKNPPSKASKPVAEALAKKAPTPPRRVSHPAAPPVARVEPRYTYPVLYAARQRMQTAGELVAESKRKLVSAEAYWGDFSERERRIAEAKANHDAADRERIAAKEAFEEMRRKAAKP